MAYLISRLPTKKRSTFVHVRRVFTIKSAKLQRNEISRHSNYTITLTAANRLENNNEQTTEQCENINICN